MPVNGQVSRKILNQAGTWYDEAQTQMEKGNRDQGFFNFGKVLHMVQDSYAEGHVARDSNGQILFFQGYDKQDPDKHASDDNIPKYGKWTDVPNAQQAYDTSVVLMTIFKNRASSKDFVDYLKTHVYQLAPDAASQVAGGTLDKYAR